METEGAEARRRNDERERMISVSIESIEARLLDGIIAWGVKLQSHMQLVVRGLTRRRTGRQQGVRQA